MTKYAIVALTLLLTSALYAGDRDALVFNSRYQYVTVADTDELDFGAGDFTVSAWIKTTRAPGSNDFPMILSKDPVSGDRTGWALFIQQNAGLDGKVVFALFENPEFAIATSTTSINDGEWHHVAGVKTGSDIQIIVDGVSEASETHSFGSLSNDLPLSIGRSSSNNAWFYGGMIAEARVWNVARPAADILADKDSKLSGTEQGLVAYWPMDEGMGPVANDIAGSNQGVLGSSSDYELIDPIWASGAFPHGPARGNSMLFDGINDAVIFAETDEHDFEDGAFTVSAWIKTNQSPNGLFPIIIQKESGVGTSRQGYNLFLFANGRVSFQLISGNSFVGAATPTSVTDGHWHHLTGVNTGSEVQMYLDGKLVNSAAHAMPTLINDQPLIFGAASAPFQWPYQGLLDDVRLWNVARTPEQVQAEFDIKFDGTESGLIGYWDFDESAGEILTDKTGNHDGMKGSLDGEDFNDPMWVSSPFPLTVYKDSFEDPP